MHYEKNILRMIKRQQLCNGYNLIIMRHPEVVYSSRVIQFCLQEICSQI